MKKTPASPSLKRPSIVAAEETQSFEKIFSLFKEKLASGDLKPGQRLLPERELAQSFGISRASLREVMRAMTLLGVIETRPGQGTFVTSPRADVLRDFFGVLLSMEPSLYDDVVEARLALECQAARLACEHARKPDIDLLERALEKINRTLADDDAGGEADFEFHDAIIRASHNEVLRFIHEAIQALLLRSHLERRQALRQDRALRRRSVGSIAALSTRSAPETLIAPRRRLESILRSDNSIRQS